MDPDPESWTPELGGGGTNRDMAVVWMSSFWPAVMVDISGRPVVAAVFNLSPAPASLQDRPLEPFPRSWWSSGPNGESMAHGSPCVRSSQGSIFWYPSLGPGRLVARRPPLPPTPVGHSAWTGQGGSGLGLAVVPVSGASGCLWVSPAGDVEVSQWFWRLREARREPGLRSRGVLRHEESEDSQCSKFLSSSSMEAAPMQSNAI